MKTRMIFLSAIVLAAALLFTGCSTQDSDSKSETTTVQNSENTQEVEEEQKQEQQEKQQEDTTDTTSQRISREKAVQIVLSRVDGAVESNIHELKTDQDDGLFVYEGELLFDGYEYEFEIDGRTGEIIKWEIDRE